MVTRDQALSLIDDLRDEFRRRGWDDSTDRPLDRTALADYEGLGRVVRDLADGYPLADATATARHARLTAGAQQTVLVLLSKVEEGMR